MRVLPSDNWNAVGPAYENVFPLVLFPLRRMTSLVRRTRANPVRSNLAFLFTTFAGAGLRYSTALLLFFANSAHLGRRLVVAERGKSQIFPRPLSFLLTTAWALSGVLWLIKRHFHFLAPISNSKFLAENWEKYVFIVLFSVFTPLIVLAMALISRTVIFVCGLWIPRRFVADRLAWWTIPFLLDRKTWHNINRAKSWLLLAYAGPYVLLTCAVVVSVFLMHLGWTERFIVQHPGRLSTGDALLLFRIMWLSGLSVVAERVCVTPFAICLPFVMEGPTRFMTRMAVPRLHSNLNTLAKRLDALVKVEAEGNRAPSKPVVSQALFVFAALTLFDLEADMAAYRSLRFPFRTDFVEIENAGPVLNQLAALFVGNVEASAILMRFTAVLQGYAEPDPKIADSAYARLAVILQNKS